MFCKIVITDSTYTTINGTVLTRNAPMTCKTQDLIYCLICDNCKKEYLGETGIQINERTNLHRNQIKHEKYGKLNVCKHIRTCSNEQFKIFPFHKCYKSCHIYREEMEWKYREEVRPGLH